MRDGKERYGFQVIDEIARLSGGGYAITEGALYPALCKLEDSGYVKSRSEIAQARTLKRYYQITSLGQEVLDSEMEKFVYLAKGVSQLFNLKERMND